MESFEQYPDLHYATLDFKKSIRLVSDVHGRLRDLRWLLNNETADAMFYLGDGLYAARS